MTGPNQCMTRGSSTWVYHFLSVCWLERRLLSSPKSLQKSPQSPTKCLSSLLFHAFFYAVDEQKLSLVDMNHIPSVPVLGPIPTSALPLASC